MKRTVNLRDMSATNNGQNPQGSQEATNRKILSDLQKEKARLRMMSQQGGLGPSSMVPRFPVTAAITPVQSDSPQVMNMNQRNAMQMAHSTSFGYFIPQDSAFGNVILPVVPRVGPNQ